MAWLGAISASYAVLPLVFAIFIGRRIDRRGEYAALVGGAVLMTAATAGLLFLGTSVAAIVVSSAVLGLGQLLVAVASQALTARLSGPDTPRAFGYYTFASSVGQLLGSAVLGLLGGSAAVPDTALILVVSACVGVPLCLITVSIRVPPVRDRVQSDVDRRVATALRAADVRRALLVSVIVVAVNDLMLVYLPALGAERGIPAGVIGALLTLRSAASMASRFALGALARRAGTVRLLVLSTGISAASIVVFALPVPVLAVAVVVVGGSLGISQPLTMSQVADSAGEQLRATALALRMTGNRVGQAALPTAVGLVAGAGGAAAVFVGLAAALATASALARGGP